MRSAMINDINIVLVNPSHPGNIGAAARAMKNMGLSKLTLVNPIDFPSFKATVRAAGADDILEKVTITDSVANAVADNNYIFATTARERALDKTCYTPHAAADAIVSAPDRSVAILFGRERSGLTNEELALAQSVIHIPTQTEFSSLNLGAAVQVIVYELRMRFLNHEINDVKKESRDVINGEQMQGLMDHMRDTLIKLDFLNPAQPKMLMQRLQRLFHRAEIDVTELNILRGILNSISPKDHIDR